VGLGFLASAGAPVVGVEALLEGYVFEFAVVLFGCLVVGIANWLGMIYN